MIATFGGQLWSVFRNRKVGRDGSAGGYDSPVTSRSTWTNVFLSTCLEIDRSPATAGGAAVVFKSARGYCPSGSSSTRRFWARPSAVALVATKWVLP
jgi:hypothetical protein